MGLASLHLRARGHREAPAPELTPPCSAGVTTPPPQPWRMRRTHLGHVNGPNQQRGESSNQALTGTSVPALRLRPHTKQGCSSCSSSSGVLLQPGHRRVCEAASSPNRCTDASWVALITGCFVFVQQMKLLTDVCVAANVGGKRNQCPRPTQHVLTSSD